MGKFFGLMALAVLAVAQTSDLRWSGTVYHSVCTEWRLTDKGKQVAYVEQCRGGGFPVGFRAYLSGKALGNFATLSDAQTKAETEYNHTLPTK